MKERPSDVIRAARLSVLTVAWNVVVGGAAVATAISAGSLSLIGFGINAVVDSSVSVLLVWRFHAEDRGHVERAERAEAREDHSASEDSSEELCPGGWLKVASGVSARSIQR